jgi:DNA-binding MarR family transcriptional regulator
LFSPPKPIIFVTKIFTKQDIKMDTDVVKRIRKLIQLHAYTSIQMHEAIARKAGLSGTDHKYLGFLIEKGQMTAGELARLSGLTTGAVTGLIDRFEKKKLLKRKFEADDRRKVILVPNTSAIMELLQPLYKEFRSKTEKLIGSFSDKEIRTIETYFSKAIEITNETTSKLSSK